jgi:hypothetical protein
MPQRNSHPRSQALRTAPPLGLMGRLRATRAARNDHRILARELSAFRSPADLLELSAILNRYPEAETVQIRRAVEWHPIG